MDATLPKSNETPQKPDYKPNKKTKPRIHGYANTQIHEYAIIQAKQPNNNVFKNSCKDSPRHSVRILGLQDSRAPGF